MSDSTPNPRPESECPGCVSRTGAWRISLAAVGLVAAGGLMSAAPTESMLESLVSKSPFGSAAPAGSTSPTVTPLEFRGVFVDRGELFFSIYDGNSRQSTWVGINEPGGPIVVKSYDASKREIVVEHQGGVITVPLKEAKVVALPSVAPSSPSPASVSANVQTPAVTAKPSDEASRLAQIAEEIRRRRALRAQATQQQAATSAPANPAQQPRPATP